MSNDAAGFTRVTARSVASPNGAFDAGLRPDPFPDRAASLLPGLLAATRTGLTPAGDDELMSDHDHVIDLRPRAPPGYLCRHEPLKGFSSRLSPTRLRPLIRMLPGPRLAAAAPR